MDERREPRPHARRGADGLLESRAARSCGARATRAATASSCARRTTTATATRCCSGSSRKGQAPATPVPAPASSASSAREPRSRPATSSTRSPREHSVVPVWTELLGDLETPVAAFLKLVGDGPGFLLESVEHGERWSRFSFVGRDPSATLTLRDGELTIDGDLPPGIPTDQGILAAIEALLSVYSSPSFPDLPPLHGGIMGYLGYDVIREVERLPERAARRPRAARRGDERDRFARRVRPLAPARLPDRERADARTVTGTARRRVRRRRGVGRAGSREPRAATAVRAGRTAPESTTRCRTSGRRCRTGCTSRRSRWPRSTSSTATSSRSCSPSATTSTLDADPFDVYRVLRQVNPSPYMYFLRHDEITIVGSSPEPMVQVLGRKVISRPIAGTRRRGTHRRGRSPDGGRADRAPEGTRRARDARRPGPQRRRTGGAVRDASTSTS